MSETPKNPEHQPPKKDRIVKAIGALPLPGKATVSGYYREGLRAVAQGDRPAADQYISFLHEHADIHVHQMRAGGALCFANILLAADSGSPVISSIAAGIAGGYSIINSGVIYTQRTMADRLHQKVKAMPEPLPASPDESSGPPSRVPSGLLLAPSQLPKPNESQWVAETLHDARSFIRPETSGAERLSILAHTAAEATLIPASIGFFGMAYKIGEFLGHLGH